MATQGPNVSAYDASTFARVKDYAGSVQGVNAALAAFGWVQSSDSNQIDWTNATAAPFATSTWPPNVTGTNATASIPWEPYKINLRGNWVTSTTYNYLDVVRSTVGGGGNGNDYILSRAPFIITAIAFTGNVATITAQNNLTAGELVTFPHVSNNALVSSTVYTVLASGLSSSAFQITVPPYTTGFPTAGPGNALNEGAGNSTTSPSFAVIAVNSATRPESDTKNYVAYFYEIWKTGTADTQTYSETAQTVQYVASSNTLTVNTSTTPNRFKAGFNVTISGATNVPQINGTWCVNSATTTQLTFIIPTSVTGFSGNFGPTSDSFTLTYTLQPVYMKLEYWSANTQPWVRVSVGQGEDGNGNLTGSRFAHDVAGSVGGLANFGIYYSNLGTASAQSAVDLRTSATANTSNIWRSIWSGSSNRFGTIMFYNRNDTNAANGNGGPLFWILERGIDNSSGGGAINYIDDYVTVLLGAASTSAPLTTNDCVMQRTILKNNPSVSVTGVFVDGSNNVTATYTNAALNNGFQFQVGSIVSFQGQQYATFLNGQLIRVQSVTLKLTSVANASGGNTVYTGTITGGANNFYSGTKFTIVPDPGSNNATGFANAANNGTFTCVASTTTTLTLNNASGTSETRTAAAQPQAPSGLVTGTLIVSNPTYGPQLEAGVATQSVSLTSFAPIAGTGGLCLSDDYICTPRIGTSMTTLTLNGNTGLLPVFPTPGYVGNLMSMCFSVLGGDAGAHDTTTSFTVYGASHTYYQTQGTGLETQPLSFFGNAVATNMLPYLRWD